MLTPRNPSPAVPRTPAPLLSYPAALPATLAGLAVLQREGRQGELEAGLRRLLALLAEGRAMGALPPSLLVQLRRLPPGGEGVWVPPRPTAQELV